MFYMMLMTACGNQGVGGDQLSDKGSSGDDTGLDGGDDSAPPIITFAGPDTNQPSGEDVVLDASISDEGSGVFTATLYYRNETDGSGDWKNIGFVSVGSDLWEATIQADEQHSGGMWYYLRAVDHAQNESYFPDDGPADPLHFGYTD